MSSIKDINLAPSGAHKIDWVRKNCPLLRSLEDDFSKEKPFEGIRIALSIHLEAKTAYLCKVLAAGGAEMNQVKLVLILLVKILQSTNQSLLKLLNQDSTVFSL